VVLLYNEETFVLLNRSDRAVDITNLEFVQLTNAGEQASFGTWELTGSDPIYALRPGNCYQLVPFGVSDPRVPDFCRRRASWQSLGPRRLFWIHEDPNTRFIVRREGDVLATCPVNEGECYVNVN
jgi:hypothetical protein